MLPAFEEYMVRQMEEIKMTLRDMRKGQASMKLQLERLLKRGQPAGSDEPLPDDISFPLGSIEQVDALNNKLADVRLQNCVVSTTLNFRRSV